MAKASRLSAIVCNRVARSDHFVLRTNVGRDAQPTTQCTNQPTADPYFRVVSVTTLHAGKSSDTVPLSGVTGAAGSQSLPSPVCVT